MVELRSVASELYSLTPDTFTARRNEEADAVRRSGDKELATRIRRLPKPSAAAWIMNMLVRHRSAEIAEVLDLGASLRAAQEDLDRDELRELSGRRQKLLAAVVIQARSLAEELGHSVSESAMADLAQTLQAAMADPRAADAVQSGLLTRALLSTGWEPVNVADAVAVPAVGTSPHDSPRDGTNRRATRERAKARREAEAAARSLEEATADLRAIEERVDALEPQRRKLEAERDRLHEHLTEVEKDLVALDRKKTALERDRERADRSAAEAEGSAAEARNLLVRLSKH